MEFTNLTRFINQYEIKWSDATTMAYESDIRLFLEDMALRKKIDNEDLFLQSITNNDYEDWKEQTKEKYTLTTVNRKITALSAFFKYITVNKKITEKNIMEGVELIKVNGKKISPYKAETTSDILTKEELLKVLECSYKKDVWQREFELCSSRDRFLLSFEATTGIRIGEAINITFDMIEEVEGGYMVSVAKEQTKTNQYKRIPIANKCLKYYEEYIEYREHFDKAKGSEYLIVSCSGEQMTKKDCNKNIVKLLQKADIQEKHITNHSHRHMFRTWATVKGVQENLIKLIGGWKLDKVASIYIQDGIDFDSQKIMACDLI